MDTLEVPPLSPSSTEVLSQALQAGFSGFTRERNQRHVPADPRCWSLWEVNYWLDWCQAEFGLRDLGPDLRALQGLDLCGLDRESFLGLTSDGAAGEILWEHLKSMQRETDSVKVPHSGHSDGVDSLSRTGPVQDTGPVPGTGVSPAAFTLPQTHTAALTAVSGYTGSRSIRLWQFLLELLTDGSCQSFISWTGNGWEFKLTDPDQVALLWGRRKNKPKMNYEKLSRGLRYYYDKNIIRKTSGQRYVYRFVCNLQGLLGYQAGEPRARLDAVHQQEPQTTKTA